MSGWKSSENYIRKRRLYQHEEPATKLPRGPKLTPLGLLCIYLGALGLLCLGIGFNIKP